MSDAHYVQGYRRFTARLGRQYDEDCAALLAVGGGSYTEHGEVLRRTLISAGMKSGDVLIDVGCGSGRLSSALSRSPTKVSYLGTDVVPELLEYARRRCDNKSFQFIDVEGLSIPAQDNSVDVVAFFSVLTHLNPDEQLRYLREARRVLKPTGFIVVSYIELWRRPIFAQVKFQLSRVKHALFRHAFKSVSSSDAKMQAMGKELGMRCTFLGPVIGQSLCTYSF